jgi:hypothetical protein
MLITTQISAGERLEFYEPGDFFRLLDATFPVKITYYKNGQEIALAEGVGEGYAEKFDRQEFDRYTITSVNAQTIQFAARLGNQINYDAPPTGDVNILNKRGAFTQSTKTVTTASALLLAAKPLRSYLLIQNNSTTGDIFINLAGAGATVTDGIKIAANGGSYELQDFNPTGAIFAIGSIASNANVIVVEG